MKSHEALVERKINKGYTHVRSYWKKFRNYTLTSSKTIFRKFQVNMFQVGILSKLKVIKIFVSGMFVF